MDSRRSARQCGKCRFYLDVCPCLFRKKVGYFDNCGPKGCRGRAESSLVRPQAHTPCPGWGPDAPTTARMVGLPPRVGQYFLSKRKKVPKKARGTATLAARPAMRNSQISAFRALPCPALVFAQACQSLTAFGSCAHWAHAPSRPKLRSAGAERLDDPNKFGSSNSGLRAGTV